MNNVCLMCTLYNLTELVTTSGMRMMLGLMVSIFAIVRGYVLVSENWQRIKAGLLRHNAAIPT